MQYRHGDLMLEKIRAIGPLTKLPNGAIRIWGVRLRYKDGNFKMPAESK